MKILRRSIVNVLRGLATPSHWRGIGRCFRVFRHPHEVVWAYLRRRRPGRGYVETRRGLRIWLSSDPADVVTVVVVFARQDYGQLPRGGVVVDIGANIGVFALGAVAQGARRVIAVEPSAESFDTLSRNVSANELDDVIEIRRAAVTSEGGCRVMFPRRSDVMNRIGVDGRADACDEVETTTLASLVDSVAEIDLLKMDCEGSEYDILFNTEPDVLRKIKVLVAEFHPGPVDRLVSFLNERGLACVGVTADNRVGGVFRFRAAHRVP